MSSDLGSIPASEQESKVHDMPKSDMTKKDTDAKENVNSESDSFEKGKTLPEPIRVGKDMPRLPPIDMAELTSILQGPNMPSQKLMKEVTEKIKLKNDESGSDDGSVNGGGVGIRGILDCILEVSLFHQDSDDESDTEGDEIFVRELPCRFCKKIFGSTMTLNTHVLMTHSQEDPSVLNMGNQSGKKEKLSPLGRSRSTEAKEKECATNIRKRASVGLQESSNIPKDDLKKSRSRHSSKEQTLKTGDNKKEEEKPKEQSCPPEASAADTSKTTTSSQRTTRLTSCHDTETDAAKNCDLKSSSQTEQSTPSNKERNTPTASKKSKRKSSMLSKDSASDSPSPVMKKARRSRNQSGDSIGKQESSAQLRRSSRKK